MGHAALDHAHSNYMHILATTGLIGMLAYLFLWGNVLVTAFSNFKSRSENDLDKGIYFGILTGVISVLVAGIFEYNFGTAQNSPSSMVLFRNVLMALRHRQSWQFIDLLLL